MISKELVIKELRKGGKIDLAADKVAEAIRHGSPEMRRRVIYEYADIKIKCDGAFVSMENGENVDEIVFIDILKRYLIYQKAFRKLKIDPDSVLSKHIDEQGEK